MGSAFIIRELAPAIQRQLTARLPNLLPWAFEHAVSGYMAARDDPAPSPGTVRDELAALATQADRLLARLNARTDRLDDYLALREIKHGGSGLARHLTDNLRHLLGLVEMARRDAEADASSGAPLAPRTLLIAELASALRQSGYAVDAKPQGPLVLAFGIALEAAGDPAAGDPAGSVAKALENLRGKQ